MQNKRKCKLLGHTENDKNAAKVLVQKGMFEKPFTLFLISLGAKQPEHAGA